MYFHLFWTVSCSSVPSLVTGYKNNMFNKLGRGNKIHCMWMFLYLPQINTHDWNQQRNSALALASLQMVCHWLICRTTHKHTQALACIINHWFVVEPPPYITNHYEPLFIIISVIYCLTLLSTTPPWLTIKHVNQASDQWPTPRRPHPPGLRIAKTPDPIRSCRCSAPDMTAPGYHVSTLCTVAHHLLRIGATRLVVVCYCCCCCCWCCFRRCCGCWWYRFES